MHIEKEEKLAEAFRMDGDRICMIVEGQTLLDRKYLEVYSNEITVSFAPSFMDNFNASQLVVVDDFIMTSTLDPSTSARIDALYEGMPTEKDIDPRKILETFKGRIDGSIVLERSPVKAKKMRRNFEEFFGVH